MNTMKSLRITYLTILISLISISTVSTQTMKAFVAAAENSFLTKDYYSALVYYNDALEFDEDRIDLRYQAAEAARLFNAYALAEEYYATVNESDENGDFPLSAYWLADVKQKQGQYEEAKFLYDQYISENEGDEEYFTMRAKKESAACQWAIDVIQNPDESTFIRRLGEEVNTGYSEFGGIKKQDSLIFSALKFERKNDDFIPERVYSKVLVSVDGSISEELSNMNKDEVHTAHTAFNTDASVMYYTLCDYMNGEDIRCDIYRRSYNSDGTLGAEEKLPDFINSDAFTTTQPNIGLDTDSGKEILYFVSDRPGGEGKLDIWYSVIDQELGFTEPINLSAVNTLENDITPFFHQKTNTLFFSSEGYRGIGGYDIYRSGRVADGFYDKPEHLTYPTNSSYHDIYYTLSEEADTAYFSSNREGSLFIDEGQEACCFDIYEVAIEKVLINLNALTFYAKTASPLENTNVRLVDPKTGIDLMNYLNPDANDHFFELENGEDYMVIAERPGYTSDTIQFSTSKMYKSQELTKKLFLDTDKVELEVLTFNALTNAALEGTTVSLIEVGTNGESQVITNNDGNTFSFMVEPGKTYKLTGVKSGLISANMTFTVPADPTMSKISKSLYLGNIGVYLPVKLYFDNDRPDRRTLRTNTKKTYTDTYHPYYALKPEFMTNYARGFKGDDRSIAKTKVERFFEDEVKQGFDQMNAFIESLANALRQGVNVELTVGGFASPRAQSNYNLALAQRRIATVQNELYKYNNGFFVSYLQSGQLTIQDISYGEKLAPQNISDKLNDRIQSVYSVEASRERRVEILSVKFPK